MIDLRQGSGTKSGQNSLFEKSLRETCQIYYKKGHFAVNYKKLSLIPQPTRNLGMEILICQICKKRGHGADKCRLRDPQSRRPVNVLREKPIFCQLCSKAGHYAKICPTDGKVNPQVNKNTVVCQWCDRFGHTASNYWEKQNEQRGLENKNRIICQMCNNFGHVAKNCRAKLTHSKDNTFCCYCKRLL
ncbi:hypothetical protein P5V15_014070 [Pogonomyrmex californicus]